MGASDFQTGVTDFRTVRRCDDDIPGKIRRQESLNFLLNMKMKKPDTPAPTTNSLAAERDKLGDRIQANIEALAADFAKLIQLSGELAASAPDGVFGWALSPISLQSALERAFAKAGHPSARYSSSQLGDLRKFSEFVRDGSIAATQCKRAA